MKTTNNFGYVSIIADVPNKGYCKIILNDYGTIVRASIGESSNATYDIYSANIPDSCWKTSMKEMLFLSPSCFIELFYSLKSAEQIAYAKELAEEQSKLLVYTAHDILKTALELDSIVKS
jgi:hypothetical protein